MADHTVTAEDFIYQALREGCEASDKLIEHFANQGEPDLRTSAYAIVIASRYLVTVLMEQVRRLAPDRADELAAWLDDVDGEVMNEMVHVWRDHIERGLPLAHLGPNRHHWIADRKFRTPAAIEEAAGA